MQHLCAIYVPILLLLVVKCSRCSSLASDAGGDIGYSCTQKLSPLITSSHGGVGAGAGVNNWLKLIVSKVNSELSSVTSVDVEWDTHHASSNGEQQAVDKKKQFQVNTIVTRNINGEEKKECFVLDVVNDDNFCDERLCGESTHCSDDNHCTCKGEGLWAKSLSTSSCPGESDSSCCSTAGCHSLFACPTSPCPSPSCSPLSACQASIEESPAGGTVVRPVCRCAEGEVGNGKKCDASSKAEVPRIGHDGVLERDPSSYCSCSKPVLDVCLNYECEGRNEECYETVAEGAGRKKTKAPSCRCKGGYISTPTHGCVSQNPPVLKLRCDPQGDGVMRLKQGDNYEECAVDIAYDDAQDLSRNLKISYSKPLTGGCMREMGTFYVNYTVATPWTDPPYQTVTRTVEVGDLDECNIPSSDLHLYCPEVMPRCDYASGATCKNTVGSYSCECPKCKTGDGFLPISSMTSNPYDPVGYAGGTGCVDSCKPVITIKGPNPRIFKACKCGGIFGHTIVRQETGELTLLCRRHRRRLY